MYKKIINKKAMSISIVLLVLLTMLALIATLYFFNQSQTSEKKILITSDQVDSVYGDEASLNFYLQNAFDDSTINLNFKDGKTKFIDNFRNNLNKYDKADSYFTPVIASIASDLDNKPIEFDPDKVSITLTITLSGNGDLSSESPKISYSYEKKFIRYFNQNLNLDLNKPLNNVDTESAKASQTIPV